jgi:hypothetical protein
MSKYLFAMSKDFAETLLTDDTIERIQFNGKTVGHLGRDSMDSKKKLFVWSQTPLRFASTGTKTAYSMSQPLINELQSKNVDAVFITDAESEIAFETIQNGDVIKPTDERFNNPPDSNQRIVYVNNF